MELLRLLRDRSLFRYGAIGLALLALALVLLETERPVRSADEAQQTGETRPDGFVNQGVYRSYDNEGRLSTRFETEQAEQYESAGFILMQRPNGLIYEQETRLPWRVIANAGRYLMDEELLELSGDVQVERDAEDRPATRLLTERLMLDNRDRIVHTDAAVTVLDERGETRAIGMTGRLDERVLEFDSRVRGTYPLN